MNRLVQAVGRDQIAGSPPVDTGIVAVVVALVCRVPGNQVVDTVDSTAGVDPYQLVAGQVLDRVLQVANHSTGRTGFLSHFPPGSESNKLIKCSRR